MATSPRHLYTFDEYLDLEAAANYKSEFRAGEMLAMSGGTLVRSRLYSGINAVLDRCLKGCQVFDSNLKLYIEEANEAVYPDCMALRGEPRFWKDRRDVILNPNLVVEVLSPSTQNYDRGTKAVYYRSVPSIHHILLISQDRVLVEHLMRQDERTWIVTQHYDGTDSMMVQGFEITLEEIYRDIPLS